MVVFEKICREVEAPYARVPAAVSACETNLVGTTSAARSVAGEALGGEASGGDFDFHEAAALVQPETDRPLARIDQHDVAQTGRIPVERGRRKSEVAKLKGVAPEAPRVDGRERDGLRRRPPRREDVQREHRVVEYRRSLSGREFPRTLRGTRDEPHGEASPAQLAEDPRRLARVGDVVLQGGGHRIAVYFEDRHKHDD